MPKSTWERVRKMQSAHSTSPEAIAPLVTGLNEDGTPFELTTERLGDNELVFDRALALAAGAAINTPVNEDVPLPGRLDPESRYAILVHNPGAQAVTIRLFNRETLSGGAQLLPVASITVAAGGAVQQIVQGLFLGSGASRVQVSNDAAIPAGGGFSVGVRIRRP